MFQDMLPEYIASMIFQHDIRDSYIQLCMTPVTLLSWSNNNLDIHTANALHYERGKTINMHKSCKIIKILQ